MANVAKQPSNNGIINVFHDHPTVVEVVESPAFTFHSNMKGLKGSTAGNPVHQVVSVAVDRIGDDRELCRAH